MNPFRIVTVVVVGMLILTGCASKPFYKAPAIVDISDSKVVVQLTHSNLPGNIFASKNTATMQDVQREANRGCAQYNRKAKLLSNSCGATVYDQLTGHVCAATNYLFACQEQ